MNKIIMAFTLLSICTGLMAKNISINNVINYQTLNCALSESMLTFINDHHHQRPIGIKVNQAKQTLKLGGNIYSGIGGYKYYKTKNIEQSDFSIDQKISQLRIIKIALQGYKSEEGESGIYYLIFEGKPAQVLFSLKQYLASDWNAENTLVETPQGNTKLVCVYAG